MIAANTTPWWPPSGLLALVLQSLGVKARSWQGWQIPLRTDTAHRAARITGIEVDEIKARMLEGEVAVVAEPENLPVGRTVLFSDPRVHVEGLSARRLGGDAVRVRAVGILG